MQCTSKIIFTWMYSIDFSVLWDAFKDLYLSDDGPVLPEPAVFLLKPNIVKQRQ